MGKRLTIVDGMKVEVEAAETYVTTNVIVEVIVVVLVIVDFAATDEASEPEEASIIVVGIVVVLTRRELPAPARVDERDKGRIVPPIDEAVRDLSFFFLNHEEAEGRTTGPKGSTNVAPAEIV